MMWTGNNVKIKETWNTRNTGFSLQVNPSTTNQWLNGKFQIPNIKVFKKTCSRGGKGALVHNVHGAAPLLFPADLQVVIVYTLKRSNLWIYWSRILWKRFRTDMSTTAACWHDTLFEHCDEDEVEFKNLQDTAKRKSNKTQEILQDTWRRSLASAPGPTLFSAVQTYSPPSSLWSTSL